MARRGRPTKAPPPGEKASLGLKVTAALKARLEAAAEQLDRLQRSGADKARPGGGGGGSRELVEQTGQLTSRVEEALECCDEL